MTDILLPKIDSGGVSKCPHIMTTISSEQAMSRLVGVILKNRLEISSSLIARDANFEEGKRKTGAALHLP